MGGCSGSARAVSVVAGSLPTGVLGFVNARVPRRGARRRVRTQASWRRRNPDYFTAHRVQCREVAEDAQADEAAAIRTQLRARRFDQFSIPRSVKREKPLVLTVTSTSLLTWAIAAICPSTYGTCLPRASSRARS